MWAIGLVEHIYIPIWIDLKGVALSSFYGSFAIYIPIWIDLKGVWFDDTGRPHKHLHSNMDRFESFSG